MPFSFSVFKYHIFLEKYLGVCPFVLLYLSICQLSVHNCRDYHCVENIRHWRGIVYDVSIENDEVSLFTLLERTQGIFSKRGICGVQRGAFESLPTSEFLVRVPALWL